jgi:peroxiredoxin
MPTTTDPPTAPVPPAASRGPAISGGLAIVLLAAAAVGGLFVWTRLIEQTQPTPTASAPLPVIVTDPKHRVTPEMEQASASVVGAAVPDIRLDSSDGVARSLRDLAQTHSPIALVFIKDGCPCSESAQPYYNRLFSAYGSKATFLGVIDRDAAGARAWGQTFRSSFPILADPGLSLMKSLGATNSAFFVLIDHDAVLRMWPGYSISMIEEASADLARATGLAPQPIDTSDAPENPYSGCPYDLDETQVTPSQPPTQP